MRYLNNPYTPKVEKFVNSHEFSYLAEYFYKNKCYTTYSRKTLQHKKFWDDVYDKCVNGFTNSAGIKITGQHFFYLNFVQILAEDTKAKRKKKLFPSFVDVDWEYFWYINHCKNNQLHICTVKGRRQGYSYKAAAIATYEFVFNRDSSCIIGSFFSDFSEETMGMVIENCNFINKHTEYKKQRNPDTKEFIQARFQADVAGTKVWKGYNSKVRSITYKDNEFAGVGKSADYLFLEEAGVFKNILQAWGMSEPLLKNGSTFTGVGVLFGSAGNMEAGSKYFKEIFMNPEKYGMISFQASDNPEKRIGFFSSAALGRWGLCRDSKSVWYNLPMVDQDGNSNIEAATDDILWEREVKKRGGDNKALHAITTQFPLTYQEAFLISHKSPYPIHYIVERIAELETSSHIMAGHWKANLIQTDSGIKFENSTNDPILDFPIGDKSAYDLAGCIEIYEQPYTDNPERGIYLAGIDPYDDDQADNSDSLGSCLVMNSLTNRIVAQYTARPQTAKEYYENVRRLLLYYNAIANYENNKKGLFGYFEQKNCLHLLCDTPKILQDQHIIKTVYDSGNNRKGSPATKEVNKWSRELNKTWMYEPAFGRNIEPETGITNTHVIPSITLLKELEMWNLDGNFDRHSALGMLMILKEDRFKLEITREKKEEEQNDFFSRNYDQNSYKEPNIPNYYPNN